MKKHIKSILSILTLTMLTTTLLLGCDNNKQESSSNEPFAIDAYGELDPQVSAQQIIADKM